MIFCTQCGTQLKDSDLFCFKCGAAVAKDNSETVIGVKKDTVNTPPSETASKSDKAVRKYKGVGIRFLAQIFDSIPMGIFCFTVGSIIASKVGGSTADGFELQGAPALALILLTMIFSILYFTLLEAWWNGQSIGKKIFRIQVVNKDGSKMNLSTSFLRNALRLVDGFMFYLVGAIFVWRSSKKQRLGDRLAGTVVIKKIGAGKSGRKKKKVVFGEKDRSMIDTFD